MRWLFFLAVMATIAISGGVDDGNATARVEVQAFVGNFETGDLSQWEGAFVAAPDRFVVVSSTAGVPPRDGRFMARCEVREGDTLWGEGTGVSQVYRFDTLAGHYDVLGDDSWVAYSVYLPVGFPYVPDTLGNTIFEWHGDSSAVQAPIQTQIDPIVGTHFGIFNRAPSFTLSLHTKSGFHPSMFRFGEVVTGRWVDFVLHVRWARRNGLVEGWMNGKKRFSSVRPTWYPGGEIHRVKPLFGYYRADYSQTAVLYLDAFRIGRSFNAVAPSSTYPDNASPAALGRESRAAAHDNRR